MSEVTDPALLRLLNAAPGEVTDPALLARLNARDPYAGVADLEQDPYAGIAVREGATPHAPPPQAPYLNPAEYDSTSPAWQARYGATSGNGFLQNATIGVGKLYTDALLGARQLYATAADYIAPQDKTLSGLITGQQPSRLAPLQQEAAEKRATDAAIMSTGGGKVGYMAGAAPLLYVPGANTYAGAALLGAGMGAFQPTTAGESRTLNTAINAGTNVLGQGAGRVLGNWILKRAAQPFMGWNLGTADRALASAVGSDANRLTPNAINAAYTRLSNIFQSARSPNVSTSLGQPSAQAFNEISSGLASPSARQVFEANPNVTDFLDYLTSGQPVTARQLGDLSTALRQDASQALTSEGGNRPVGLALRSLQRHVDDLVGGTISDPELATAYAAARPQYGMLMDVMDNPTLLNATTGRANMTALGKYLQRNDPQGYSRGLNQTPIYQAARWGQATGEGRGPPPLLRHLGLDWLGYRALNNPISNAIGGAVSRSMAPMAPAFPAGLQGLAMGGTPQLVSYIEQ